MTGHLGPDLTLTPIGARVYQPTIATGNEAGSVIDAPGATTFADVARVGIADHEVSPYVHTAVGREWPVTAARDPQVGESAWFSGAASRMIVHGTVTDIGIEVPAWRNWPFDLYNQVLATSVTVSGDSGAPFWVVGPSGNAVTIIGITAGWIWVWDSVTRQWVRRGVFSPVSGVEYELGVEVWTKP